MEVVGFKAFNYDMSNNNGIIFEEKKVYEVDGKIKYGNGGNGFHFCKNLEDTLRYYNGMSKLIKIASVKGIGKIKESYDDYYGYYDLYVTNKLYVERIYTREEIINYILNKDPFYIERFLMGFKLTKEELEYFKMIFSDYSRIINTISYYQEGKINVYK